MSDRRDQGLHGNFRVQRTDGRDEVGEKHHGCTYFVLDLQHDKHMPAALKAYANSCEQEFPALAADLRSVANDFGRRGQFAGIVAQKPALDLERQARKMASEPPAPSLPAHPKPWVIEWLRGHIAAAYDRIEDHPHCKPEKEALEALIARSAAEPPALQYIPCTKGTEHLWLGDQCVKCGTGRNAEPPAPQEETP